MITGDRVDDGRRVYKYNINVYVGVLQKSKVKNIIKVTLEDYIKFDLYIHK